MATECLPIWRENELWVKLPSPRWKQAISGDDVVVDYNLASFLIDIDEQLRRFGIINSRHYCCVTSEGFYKYMNLPFNALLHPGCMVPVDRRRIDRAFRTKPD